MVASFGFRKRFEDTPSYLRNVHNVLSGAAISSSDRLASTSTALRVAVGAKRKAQARRVQIGGLICACAVVRELAKLYVPLRTLWL